MAALVALPIAQQRYELTPLVNKTMAARVDSIVDGDTVHVQLADGRKLTVRLDGIDTPETGEPFAAQARNATRVLLFDQQVQLTVTDVDRYDRLVGRVRIGTKDASVELVNAGLACHFTKSHRRIGCWPRRNSLRRMPIVDSGQSVFSSRNV